MVRIDPEVLRIDSRLRLKEVVDGAVFLHHDDHVLRQAKAVTVRPLQPGAIRDCGVSPAASGRKRDGRAQR
jgi:hypothetical protein